MDDSLGYYTSLLENNNILEELLHESDGDHESEIGSDELPSDEEPSEEELLEEENQLGEPQPPVEENAEFLSNSMSFVADNSWIGTYEVPETHDENQFAKKGPINVKGDWKGLIFTDKKALSRALEEWHITHFVQLKVDKSDQNRWSISQLIAQLTYISMHMVTSIALILLEQALERLCDRQG